MRIAFIVNIFPALSETFILNQITGLLDMGHEVNILAVSNPNRQKIHPEIREYKLLQKSYLIPNNKFLRILKAFFLIIKHLRKNPVVIIKSLNIFKYGRKTLSLIYFVIYLLDEKFDIIHCHFGPNGNVGAYLKELGIISGKLVTSFHGSDIRLGIKKGGKIYKPLFEHGNCFLANSYYSLNNLVRFGADSKKIIYHPVGVDVDKIPFKWDSSIDKKNKIPIILTVARLSKEKGLEYGIQAVRNLLGKNPDLHLRYNIIGGGPLKNRLTEQVKELNLEKIVCFLGPMIQEEVIRNMIRSDIFILPSIAEAFGLVLLEAQAVGLPVVATNVGSVSDAIANEGSGFLVPARDSEALAEKIEYLIRRPNLWSKIGKNGRKYVEKKYDIKKLNQRLIKIYQDLIK